MNQYDGSVVGVSSDTRHGFSKPTKQHIILIESHGVEGDAHAGKYVRHRFIAKVWPTQTNRRQVHLIRAELFDELRDAGHPVSAGDLGENVTTTGLELEHLPLGTKLHLGETAIIELTGLRTPCALIDRFQKGLRKKMISDAVMPKYKCGVLGVVIAGGRVESGDAARVETPALPFLPLPAM
ncbi:MAG: MOSC domain-containing protein [Bradyrhizobium sp.]|uniref:MOSC domain-containing protein n=1 Tax=Bradyrhizobium sp. TaxID=376 RepID=UPI001C29881A|nr:MOSC domain-containing protein [Bradyrhizobium sp.]MBU6463202.1 MOSC domain-containing protein [Pseudomonadota bacterium]MDE2067009.1 MOSC domain-containing protein [Bradyrhizobium sp.]MDE2472118.1 MOSC domain-containing protein [Bradyrhizobium sp.]